MYTFLLKPCHTTLVRYHLPSFAGTQPRQVTCNPTLNPVPSLVRYFVSPARDHVPSLSWYRVANLARYRVPSFTRYRVPSYTRYRVLSFIRYRVPSLGRYPCTQPCQMLINPDSGAAVCALLPMTHTFILGQGLLSGQGPLHVQGAVCGGKIRLPRDVVLRHALLRPEHTGVQCTVYASMCSTYQRKPAPGPREMLFCSSC
jgi:hypothetical protein